MSAPLLPFASFSIRRFRSFLDTDVSFENLSGINIVVGQNNAGKSNTLVFINRLINRGKFIRDEIVDRPRTKDVLWPALDVVVTRQTFSDFIAPNLRPEVRQFFDRILLEDRL